MKRIILFLISLAITSSVIISCTIPERPAYEVGTVVTETDVECVKSDSRLNPGMNWNGDIHFNYDTTCLVAVCIRKQYKLGKMLYSRDLIFKEVVDMKECVH